jgi:N-acetyl-anhydromuramyl-L-alanine amidase AmpD
MSWKPIKEHRFMVVHCAATKADMDIGAKEIRQWHFQRGWMDIGYHYVIRRNGAIEEGRPVDRPGAHARGFNHLSLGICLVGGVAADGKTPENNFTPDQFHALLRLLQDLKQKHPDATVIGHRDLPNVKKGCPSFDVQSWWEEENKYVSEPTSTSTSESRR